jgi:hypothetical protein
LDAAAPSAASSALAKCVGLNKVRRKGFDSRGSMLVVPYPEGVPTFVQVTRPYRGSLIAGMRPTADGEMLFEDYACDEHKAALRSSSSIEPRMIGRYHPGQAYLAAQGRVFVVRYGYGEAANWHHLEDVGTVVYELIRFCNDFVFESPLQLIPPAPRASSAPGRIGR